MFRIFFSHQYSKPLGDIAHTQILGKNEKSLCQHLLMYRIHFMCTLFYLLELISVYTIQHKHEWVFCI
jgi:hypothetical protein